MMNMMEPQKMFETLMDFQKTMITGSVNMMTMSRDRSGSMTGMFMEHAFWMSEKWKNAIVDWQEAYQEGCQIFTQTINDRTNNVNLDLMQQWSTIKADAAKSDSAG